jgi:hypothetical protein
MVSQFTQSIYGGKMSEFLKRRPEDVAGDTWLSDFLMRFNAAQEAFEKYPTEQNRERWEMMLEMKKVMIVNVQGILDTYKEAHVQSRI